MLCDRFEEAGMRLDELSSLMIAAADADDGVNVAKLTREFCLVFKEAERLHELQSNIVYRNLRTILIFFFYSHNLLTIIRKGAKRG